jgi:hypothetical protein
MAIARPRDLDDVEAVELMVELVRAAGASRGKLR